MTPEEKKCEHKWAMADEPCFCDIEGSDCQKAHVSYYCSKCGEDKCVWDVVQKALSAQKSEFENEKQELFAEWARQKIELTERNKNLLAKVLEIVENRRKEIVARNSIGSECIKNALRIIELNELKKRIIEELA